MENKELREILSKHLLWVEGKDSGESANLRDADLRCANLRHANLRDANLRHADLSGANLRHANLRDADLRDADLRYANLRHADLSGANLRHANLRDADLRDADLRYANLRNADLVVLSLSNYTAYVQRDYTRIGCEHHSNDNWLKWELKDVKHMAGDASDWWRKYKPIIVAAIKIIQESEEIKNG